MKFKYFDSYEEMSAFIANEIAACVKEKPECVLGLATGSTPIGAYDALAAMYDKGEIDFSGVTTFNLDEYYGLSPENDQSYRYFMEKYLFSRVNIRKDSVNIPSGLAKDVEAECEMYDKKIEAAGGIDIQILGIGGNGHIGFNEPAKQLYSKTHLTSLTEGTIEANSRFFAKKEDVPTKALTMGMGSILKAKKIIIAANGESKKAAVEAVKSGMIDTSCPATLLNVHNDVTFAVVE